jgi:hypothetical protein
MSETYDSDGEGRTAFGGFIVAVVSLLSAVLVIAGLIYATGANARTRVELAANDCEPTLYLSGMPCITQQELTSEYEGIVNPASKQLSGYVATYQANETNNLGAAELALRSEAATERTLDSRLATLMFSPQNMAKDTSALTIDVTQGGDLAAPPAVAILSPQVTVTANALVQTEQALVTLTDEQAQSSSLTQLRSFNSRVDALEAKARTDMTLIRKAIAVRPTANEEP